MNAVLTEGLTKHYRVGFLRSRPYVALDSLDLQVPQGEVFGFLGPNGAGKTTTLKLLVQLIFPTAGRATILGRPAGDVEVRRRIGYLPENPSFYDNVSAEELLEYFASLFGHHGAERKARVARLLDEVGLGAERRLQLRRYSKGMIQRVGLAQALLNDPDVVFLDEPMSGLDPLGRRDVRDLILRLRDRGATVFFSSHILPDAEAICSRAGILAGGRLVASGTLAEMVPFRIKGWDVVFANLSASAAQALRDCGATVTMISADRGHATLSRPVPPDDLVARARASGAELVSLNPVRDTLEDFFVAKVQGTERQSGLQSDRRTYSATRFATRSCTASSPSRPS
jgi:ABC-2 type transport system ATP-binding protein